MLLPYLLVNSLLYSTIHNHCQIAIHNLVISSFPLSSHHILPLKCETLLPLFDRPILSQVLWLFGDTFDNSTTHPSLLASSTAAWSFDPEKPWVLYEQVPFDQSLFLSMAKLNYPVSIPTLLSPSFTVLHFNYEF